jgi:translation initiation factor 5B
MVPTSAHTGDGMGSLIAMIIEKCQTTLAKRLSYTDELQATVMEVSYYIHSSRLQRFRSR